MTLELFDTHAHLDSDKFARDLPQVFQRMADAGVTRTLCAAFDLPSSRRSVALAEKYDGVWAAVGIHPHDAQSVPEDYIARMEDLARHPKVVALGEMGLDFYRDLSPRDVQRRVFREQLALVRQLNKPVIIHIRDAFGEAMEILRQDGISPAGGVMHCFSGSWETAQESMAMGFYISLAGPVTFKNAVKLKDIARRVPEDRLLIETDCPYLTPEPRRGRRNEPAYVRYLAEHIADLRGVTLEHLARVTTANAKTLFNI